MPRLHYVRKAQKDNPAVAKGQPYWWWKFPYRPKQYSATRPRRSQLTQSDKLGRIYDVEDDAAENQRLYVDRYGKHGGAFALDTDLLTDQLREGADELDDVAEEYREGIENMPEALQQSQNAMESEEKADACEATAEMLREVADDLENVEEQFREFNEQRFENEDPYEATYEWVIDRLGEIEWPAV